MRSYWKLARRWVDKLSLRERVLIFLAVAFVLVALVNFALLDPLFERKQALTTRFIQQQEKLKELQARLDTLLQARRHDVQTPLRVRLAELRQQVQEQGAYLQSRHEHLVEPKAMASLLEQVLRKNGQLQLLGFQTLPPSLLHEKVQPVPGVDVHRPIYRHGVQLTVRGSYAEVLRYLAELEKLPVQMLWGEIDLRVERYPDAVVVLTLYTLSLDRTWLTV